MTRTEGFTMTEKVLVLLFAAVLGLYPVSGHAATLQDIENTWGKPAAVQPLDSGAEKRFYKYENTMPDLGFRYFTWKDGKLIDQGLASSLPVMENAGRTGLPVGAFDSALYATVESLNHTWGQPIAIQKLNDGSEERYYTFQNTMPDLGFRYFVLKDGKITASGLAGSIGAEATKKEMKGVRIVGFVKKAGTKSVEEIEHAWGKPVAVKKLNNGMEERYYMQGGLPDIGCRMFLFKDGRVVGSTISEKNT